MAGPVRYCPACYTVNPFEAGYCERCGAALETEESFDERLAWALRHPDTETAILAAELLGARRARSAIPALLEVAASSDPYRAAAAVRALGAFTAVPGVWARLRRLADAPSVIVRRAVAAVLAGHGSAPEADVGRPLEEMRAGRRRTKRADGRRAGAPEGRPR